MKHILHYFMAFDFVGLVMLGLIFLGAFLFRIARARKPGESRRSWTAPVLWRFPAWLNQKRQRTAALHDASRCFIAIAPALGLLMLLAILSLQSYHARAAEYGIVKTFWNFHGTNAPGTATNIPSANAVLDATTMTDFSLQVQVGLTNASAGSLDIAWAASADMVNFSTNNIGGRNGGWFSVPLTNTGPALIGWITNITVDAAGYWKIRYVTNSSGEHMTNCIIRAYAKPRRSG